MAESIYPFYLRAAMRRGDKVAVMPLPVLDEDFMNSHEARWLRILAETTYAQVQMKQLGVHNTIVFFGSAQIPPPEEAEAGLNEARRQGDATEIARAEKIVEISRYYDQARELAARLTRWAMDQGTDGSPQPFAVCTGGGPSIMEAASRGAHDVGGKSVGLSIFLPHEQKPNPYIPPELNFTFQYFFTRKFHFLYRAKGVVVFPGGYGSLDELFEVLNLIKTRKIIKQISVVLFGSKFWSRVVDFEFMIECGVISREDLSFFTYADSVDEAFEKLTDNLKRYLRK
ncbi:MAG TPA: LOG family protein [Candidatus Glassbacteria bacterium]|nr:LOG family protein [Candidatus Glassbacteria bacterium]